MECIRTECNEVGYVFHTNAPYPFENVFAELSMCVMGRQ